MPRWARIICIAGGSFIGLIVILWLILALIIRQNKEAILAEITSQLGSHIEGTLTIEDMEPSLIRGFPNISVTLKNVSLKDSLFSRHQHQLLRLQEVFVKVGTFAIIRKKVDIQEVFLKGGSIHMYTDSTGYSNTYLLKSRKRSDKSKSPPKIGRFRIQDVTWVLEDQTKFKSFRLDIHSLRGQMEDDAKGWKCALQMDIHIRDMAFNTTKGSYAKDKLMKANVEISYEDAAKTLHIPPQLFHFNRSPVLIGGRFNFSEKPAAFSLQIKADQLTFADAISMLPPSISGKLDSIQFAKPLDVAANLDGHMKYRDTPSVNVTWVTQDNILTAKNISLEQCSFSGSFLNEVQPGMGHNDANSRLSIYGLKGVYEKLPVSADTIRVFNLQHPQLTGRFRSKFPLGNLTELLGGQTFRFDKGEAEVDLQYFGTWIATDTLPGSLKGFITVKNGAFTYLPRDHTFENCNALLEFTGQHLFFRNIHVQSGKSSLQMEGNIRNMLNFYFAAPEKLQLEWAIRSPLIDLNEFRGFFGQRKKRSPPAARKKKMARLAQQLEVVMDQSSVHMQLNVDKLQYKKFTAQNVRATVLLSQNGLSLKDAALQAAGGDMKLSGNILQNGAVDKFSVQANVKQVQVEQLFYAFDDFGLSGLRSKNIRGVFSAAANIRGNMKTDAQIVPHSMFGSLKFDLNKGALLKFEPLESLGRFLFRKRDLSNVTFEKISNTLDIRGDKVYIPPMTIASSVVNVQVEGIYGFLKGTDIKLQVPLRNPKKDELVTDNEELKKRRKSGIVINLNAVDGEDGKVKFKLGKGKTTD